MAFSAIFSVKPVTSRNMWIFFTLRCHQTWRAGKYTIYSWFSCSNLHLARGFPIAMFDYQRVLGFPDSLKSKVSQRERWGAVGTVVGICWTKGWRQCSEDVVWLTKKSLAWYTQSGDSTMWEPRYQDGVQLVNITTISLGFVVVTIARWGCKPT